MIKHKVFLKKVLNLNRKSYFFIESVKFKQEVLFSLKENIKFKQKVLFL